MDALLSDINQSGVGRGLAFELFRPSAPVLKEYYAEIPISIKVSGSFHDIAYFSSDLAALPRIVTLNALNVSVPITQGQQSNNNQLILEAVAKTFRYLDQDEIATQRKTTTAQPNGTSGGAKP
jgi:type IV pilus assembly protein PilO